MLKRLLALEPVVITKLAGTIISVLVTIVGLDLDTDQQNAILGLIAAGLIFHAAFTRQAVVSPATVTDKVEVAAQKAVEKVTDGVAGAVGQVTEGGAGVVKEVTEEVVGTVGGVAGGLARGVLR